MSSSSQPIVRAKVFKIRQQSRLGSLLRTLEADAVKEFKEHLEQDNEEEAIESAKLCNSKEAAMEMLGIALDSRKNELVTKVLQEALQKENKESNGVSIDYTDSRQSTDRNEALKKAIMIPTLNDDPETLRAVLECGLAKNETEILTTEAMMDYNNKNNDLGCPILVASLQNYTQCMKELYRFGYRITLPEEDGERIKNVLMMKHALANDLHFYFSLLSGRRNIKEVEALSNTFGCTSSGRSTFFTKEKVVKVGKKSLSFDPVERFLRFKASANPNYISVEFIENKQLLENENGNEKLRLYDPIRKSFALAQYSKHLSSYYTQHSQEYLDISNKCQDFAEEVLEQCENTDQVETILEYSPNKEDDENNENTNWHLALWEGHKNFVAHHYFQNFLWDKITGKNFNWDNYFFFWRILYFPLAVILFFCLPFVVVIDSVFRDSDILFVSPEMLQKKCVKERSSEQAIPMKPMLDEENGNTSMYPMIDKQNEEEQKECFMFSFFRERIHRPIFRMIVYHFLEVTFLIALGFTMIDPNDTAGKSEFWPYDIITMVFVVSYFFEDLMDIGRRKWTFFSSFWSFFSLINHSLFVVGGIMSTAGFKKLGNDQRADISGNDPVNIGSTFVSLAATMAYFRVVRWFLLNRKLGPVVVCIIKVLKDAFHIFLLFLIIFISFAIGTFSMFKTFTLQRNETAESNFKMESEELANVKSLFSAMFWRVFDPGEPDLASIVNSSVEKSPSKDGENMGELSLQFSHFMGVAFWAIYQATIVILLINILIAMMNTTYTKVSEHADLHWKYSKSYYQVQFLAPRAVLPAPFRIFYYFAKLMRCLKTKSTCTRQAEFEKEDKEKKDKEYQKLLLKLVENKQHSDYENSVEDDFRDLRKDIQNIVSDKQKIVSEEVNTLKTIIAELKDEIKSLKTQSFKK